MTFAKRNCLLLLVLLLPSLSSAQTLVKEGSPVFTRSYSDSAPGQVYIYTGGTFPIGTVPVKLKFLWDVQGAPANTGVLTPLLFEKSGSGESSIFTVIGVGKSYSATLGTLPETVPFDIIYGSDTSDSPTTFGFVNAVLDVNGNQVVSTLGVVDFASPQNGGNGVGGVGTSNQWSFTDYDPNYPIVAVGTTFGRSGSGATYLFYNQTRTYSAEVYGYVQK